MQCFLTKTWKGDHISPVLASLCWLLKSRIAFKIPLLTYKALDGKATSYVKELMITYYPIRPSFSQYTLYTHILFTTTTLVLSHLQRNDKPVQAEEKTCLKSDTKMSLEANDLHSEMWCKMSFTSTSNRQNRCVFYISIIHYWTNMKRLRSSQTWQQLLLTGKLVKWKSPVSHLLIVETSWMKNNNKLHLIFFSEHFMRLHMSYVFLCWGIFLYLSSWEWMTQVHIYVKEEHR